MTPKGATKPNPWHCNLKEPGSIQAGHIAGVNEAPPSAEAFLANALPTDCLLEPPIEEDQLPRAAQRHQERSLPVQGPPPSQMRAKEESAGPLKREAGKDLESKAPHEHLKQSRESFSSVRAKFQ